MCIHVQVALGHEEAEICLDADPAALGFKDGEINTQRGYGHPDLHARLDGCQNSSVRKSAQSLIPSDVRVGAVRISATGWEGWIIKGLKVLAGLLQCEALKIALYITRRCRTTLAVILTQTSLHVIVSKSHYSVFSQALPYIAVSCDCHHTFFI